MRWLLLFAYTCALWGDADQATPLYHEAQQTSSVAQRQRLYNEALAAYLQLEGSVTDPSAPLLYDIGNCYFELNEYGLALWYYYRAQQRAPRDANIAFNMAAAQQRANQPLSHRILASWSLSLEEWSWLVAVLVAIALVLGSLGLWVQELFWRVAWMAVLVAAVGLGYMVWVECFSPVEAVVVRPTALYSEPSEQAAAVTVSIPPYGAKVRVLEQQGDGAWFKVQLPTGEVGYVSKEAVRALATGG